MARTICSIRFKIFSRVTVIHLCHGYCGRLVGGERCIREQAKATLEKASRAAAFGCVGGDFRAALLANSGYTDHGCFSWQSFWKAGSARKGSQIGSSLRRAGVTGVTKSKLKYGVC